MRTRLLSSMVDSVASGDVRCAMSELQLMVGPSIAESLDVGAMAQKSDG